MPLIDYTKPAVLPAWGDTNQTSADMVQPATTFIQSGWPNVANPPVRQYFNWLLRYCMEGVRYFMQRGLPDYDATEQYRVGSRIIGDDGNTYISTANTNTGNTPSTSPGSWIRWGFQAADLQNFAFNVPTATTAATSDETSKIATTSYVGQKIRLGLAYSLGSNGYIALPSWMGGLIIQWFQDTANTGTGRFEAVTNWPLAFPSSCLAAYGVPKFEATLPGGNWQGAGIYIVNFTSTQIDYYHDCRSDGTTQANYHGIFLGIGF